MFGEKEVCSGITYHNTIIKRDDKMLGGVTLNIFRVACQESI